MSESNDVFGYVDPESFRTTNTSESAILFTPDPTGTGLTVIDGDPIDRSLDGMLQGLQHYIDRTFVDNSISLGELSDGYHTFNELYHHRAILFAVICSKFPELAWKSKFHYQKKEPMYDGMFIVGINTPNGQATYHYDVDPYWDLFKVKELEYAPEWDGHTPNDAIKRIASLI